MGGLTKFQASDEPNRPQSQLTKASSAAIEPAPVKRAIAELGLCLTLVAPSGMSNSDRSEWLKVAHMTLSDIPEHLLHRGCEKARQTCRFPSEIVPCILSELEYAMRRVQEKRDALKPRSFTPPPRLEAPPEYVDAKQIAGLINKIGRT